MLDLFKNKKELPDSIYLDDGSSYLIQTDYKYWILFYRYCRMHAKLTDFLVMFPYEKPAPEQLQEAFQKLIEFANPPKTIPRSTGKESSEIILDYDIDADYIYAAFMEQYHINLLDDNLKMHWYEFSVLLSCLHDCKLTEIIGYRCYQPSNNTSYEKQMKALKEAWKIEAEEKQIDKDLEYFNSLFNC